MSTIIQTTRPWGQHTGQREGQVSDTQWTVSACPLGDTRVSRDLGIEGLSHVDAHSRSTLQRRVVVPNPQHLLLTLFLETPLHEEKFPL